MLRQIPRLFSHRGFTLIELTVGLAVLGLLLGGLFQLTAAGNRQLNDQLTAQQLQDYVKAAKSFMSAKTVDSSGNTLNIQNNANCAAGETPTTLTRNAGQSGTVLNSYLDITASVRCFRPNTLPLLAGNGGSFIVGIVRTADVSSAGIYYANYVMVVSIKGGKNFDKTSLGQIATYIGSDGAGIYSSTDNIADNANTLCNEHNNDTIRGAFGNSCVDMNLFDTTFDTLKPATLSFISALNPDISSENYLWRRTPPSAGLNEMQVPLGINTGVSGSQNGIYFGAASGIKNGGITNATGGVWTNGGQFNSQGGLITSSGGIIDAAAGTIQTSAAGKIQTQGGSISSGGGTIASGGGNITTSGGFIITSGGELQLAGGKVTAGDGAFSGQLSATSFVYTPSDRRLKKDIVPLEDQLPQLLKIHGVSYVLKKNNQKSIGVIAQDVEAVYPDLVATIDGKKMVQYTGLIGPIIESLRELKQENDDLKKRIEVLERNR